jgi:solute:Na+ symporter, SSS family
MSIWFLLLYLGLQVGLSLWLSRGIRTEGDFLLGGRKLSTPLVAFSMFATWFGAESCLGSSGAIYESGLAGARADPLGYGLCLFLLGALLAERLWKGGYVTLGDLYRARYGALAERLVVLILVPSSIIWAAAQIRAFGQVVSATMSVDVNLAIYASAAFVIAYTYYGGLMGDVLTDLIQGLILALSLLGMLWVVLDHQGGVLPSVDSIDRSRLSLFKDGEGVVAQLDRFCVPVLGSLVAQELVARVVASSSGRIAKRASFWASGLYLFVGAAPVLLGLIGPELVPHLDDPEQLLPVLARRLLPSFWYGVFSCALISAILSTIDSVLLSSAALLSHNLVVPIFGLETEAQKLRSVRGLVALSGIVSLWIALHAVSIYELVEQASAFGTAGVLVTTLVALFLPKACTSAAISALGVGLVMTPLAEYVLGWPAPFLTSIAAATGTYFAVALVRSSRPESAA